MTLCYHRVVRLNRLGTIGGLYYGNKKRQKNSRVSAIIGIILFMIPVKHNGEWTVTVKIIADYIGSWLGGILPILCVVIITVSAVLSLIALAKPKFIVENHLLKDTFAVSPIWVIVRIVGAVFIWMTYLGMGTEGGAGIVSMITDGGAGGFVLSDLLTVLVIIFLIALVCWNMWVRC